MHSLMLINVNERPISVDALRVIFRQVPGFCDIREHTPCGTPIEADFIDGEDFTTVDLNTNGEAISIRGTSGAALRAAWLIKENWNGSLRLFDTEYSFDLLMSKFSSLHDLELAIDEARASDD